MKKTLRLVGVAAMVLLLAASCKKEEKNNGEKQMMTFSAGIEQTGAKTGLQPGAEQHSFNQVWKKGDAIRVNDNETVITLDEGCDDKETGTFTGKVTATGKYYAVYPTSATLSGSTATFILPESQKYDVDSYESDLAPMAAYTENNELNFKNLCGLMELSLKGDGITVTSLELSCDKPICGTATYNIGGSEPLAMANGAGNMVSMDCGTGVPLNGTASFIFVLPPVKNGAFSLTVSYTAGANAIQMTKTLGNITIGASQGAYNTSPYELVGVNGTVTTGEVGSVTSSGASVAYTVTPNDVSRATQHGVCYSTSQNPVATGSHVEGPDSSPYSVLLTGLNASTKYYVRAYAIFAVASKDEPEVVYGEEKSFTTLSIGGTVTTGDVDDSSITATGASLGYSVAPNPGSQATQHGICYSTSEHPVYTDNPVSGTGQSPYTVSVSSLTPNKTYYYRAYAIFAVASKDEPEVVYGEEKSFTTLSIGGTVTTGDVDDSSITATGASLGYSVAPNPGSQATQHGICYSTSQNPVYTGSHVSGTGQSPYTVSVSSLTPNKTYYYRAYAIFAVASKDEPEVVYGEEKSFKTEAGSSAPDGFVDLGTHVGGVSTGKPLYWAKCNLGATNPQDYGGYYPWGDITARTNSCSWDNYKYGAGEPNVTKYCRTEDATVWRGSGSPDNILELDNSDDAAYVASGGANRMPTKKEYDELKQKAYFVWTTNYNGISIKGCIIYKSVDPTKDHGFTKTSSHVYSTAAGGDEHIFIPAGGRLQSNGYHGRGDYVKIWTKTLPCLIKNGDGWPSSFGIDMGMKSNQFIDGNSQGDHYHGRFYGMNLRPVCEGN